MDPNTSSGPNEEGPFGDAGVVIFTLDTTITNTKKSEICQIAAWCQGKTFKECILPNDRPLIKHINGFEKIDNTLFHYGQEVYAVSPKEGLQNFLDFLSGLTGNSRKILLAAHNCYSFHRYVIIRLLKEYGMLDTFKSLVLGFIDTMDVFKAILPERVKENKSYDLEQLENDYLNTKSEPNAQFQPNFNASDAVVNVKILVDLIETINCTDVIMKQHAKDLDEFIRYLDLQADFDDSTIKREILKKIAKAGITTDMLKHAYIANPGEGVSNLLRREVDGKDPVKMTNATIMKINDTVAQLCAREGNGTA